MKTKLFSMLALLISSLGFSQMNYPIPMDSTSEWRLDQSIYDGTGGPVYSTDFRVFVAGDTTIGNHVYTRLLSSGVHSSTYQGNTSSTLFENQVYAFIRNDSARIYLYFLDREDLLFDFSLQVGDTLPMTFNNMSPNVVIDSVDTVMVAGKYLKRFHISDETGILNSTWIIEGIGHEQGLLEPMQMMMDAGFYFDCYAENHIPVFPEGSNCELNVNVHETPSFDEHIQVYPNPSTGSFRIILNADSERDLNLNITGLTGNLLLNNSWFIRQGVNEYNISLSEVPAGIYFLIIQDGSSIIRKKIVLI